MEEQDQKQNNEEQPTVDSPYKQPWFIAIGVIAVLSMVGSVLLWLW